VVKSGSSGAFFASAAHVEFRGSRAEANGRILAQPRSLRERTLLPHLLTVTDQKWSCRSLLALGLAIVSFLGCPTYFEKAMRDRKVGEKKIANDP
jgi:hypothetical protein